MWPHKIWFPLCMVRPLDEFKGPHNFYNHKMGEKNSLMSLMFVSFRASFIEDDVDEVSNRDLIDCFHKFMKCVM
jgi:hypothetical protein